MIRGTNVTLNLDAGDGSRTVQHLFWRNRVVALKAGELFTLSADAKEGIVTRLAVCSAQTGYDHVARAWLVVGDEPFIPAGEWPLDLLANAGTGGYRLELPIHLRAGERLSIDAYTRQVTFFAIEAVNDGEPTVISAADLPSTPWSAAGSKLEPHVDRIVKLVTPPEE